MGQRISGSGVGLAPPQYDFPSEINPTNVPLDIGSNYQTLYPGQAIAVPAGSWYIGNGKVSVIQYLDPITQVWRGLNSARVQTEPVTSDGFNYRIANLTGCPVTAVVTNAGSGYVQASTTVTADAGGSTWRAVVGGMVSVSTISNAGSGYGLPPNLFISAPPPGGVPATGYCVITSGTVSSVVLDNVGGGYQTAPAAVIVTNPYDPNLAAGTIVQAAVTLALVGSGEIAAVLCTNNGASVASAPTLTIAGAGSSATATALRMGTFTAATVASAGTWTGGAALTSTGGVGAATSAVTNPLVSTGNFIPRPVQALLSGATSLSSVAAIYDGGLFLGTPTLAVAPVGGAIAPASTATVTATYAGAPDSVLLQPAP